MCKRWRTPDESSNSGDRPMKNGGAGGAGPGRDGGGGGGGRGGGAGGVALRYHRGSQQDMLRFAMISQWTCHRPQIARTRRSAGFCPPRNEPSAKMAGGPASAL